MVGRSRCLLSRDLERKLRDVCVFVVSFVSSKESLTFQSTQSYDVVIESFIFEPMNSPGKVTVYLHYMNQSRLTQNYRPHMT